MEDIAILLVLIILLIVVFYFGLNYIRWRRISEKSDDIKNLIRQVYRWHVASLQDENPVIKSLHSDYAMGYIQALRDIATDEEIYQLAHLDINKLQKEVTTTQDQALVSLFEKCPVLLADLGNSPAYIEYYNHFLRK